MVGERNARRSEDEALDKSQRAEKFMTFAFEEPERETVLAGVKSGLSGA